VIELKKFGFLYTILADGWQQCEAD
jgi:hypothetical protein